MQQCTVGFVISIGAEEQKGGIPMKKLIAIMKAIKEAFKTVDVLANLGEII